MIEERKASSLGIFFLLIVERKTFFGSEMFDLLSERIKVNYSSSNILF